MSINGTPAPFTLQELKAWIDLSEIKMTYDEIMHIKRLSEAFVSALNESSRKDAMPYYRKEKGDVGGKLRNALNFLREK